MNSKHQVFVNRAIRSLTLTAICLVLILFVAGCSSEEKEYTSATESESTQTITDEQKDDMQDTDEASEEMFDEENNSTNKVDMDNIPDNVPEQIDVSLANCAGATIVTSEGTVEVEFYGDKAPVAVANFCTLAKKGFYDGVVFHRVIEGFMIQGGDPEGTGRGGPGYKFQDELPGNGEYEIGSLAMANAGPNTNGSQFFIVSGPNGVNLPPLYTLFGQVTQGLDIVDQIQTVETLPGDKPAEDVIIESIEVK